MGGATTEIDDASTDVLIEAATFEPGHHRANSPSSQAAQRGLEAIRTRS